MRVLALVTARGGSKRLPGKNVRLLGGRPLIRWTLDAVLGVPGICDVLVSTDDDSIASVAREAGAMVPWRRPADLASDTAGSADVCIHALDWYEAEHGPVDGLLLLQPTSPFRRRQTVIAALGRFAEQPHGALIGVSPAESHPWLCYRLEGGTLQPFVTDRPASVRTQDMTPAVVINGALYLIDPATLRLHRTLLPPEARPFVMGNADERIDIDTEADWDAAERVVARLAGEGAR